MGNNTTEHLIFKCFICDEEFDSEENKRIHGLYVHNTLIPSCSAYNAELENKKMKVVDALMTYESRLKKNKTRLNNIFKTLKQKKHNKWEMIPKEKRDQMRYSVLAIQIETLTKEMFSLKELMWKQETIIRFLEEHSVEIGVMSIDQYFKRTGHDYHYDKYLYDRTPPEIQHLI